MDWLVHFVSLGGFLALFGGLLLWHRRQPEREPVTEDALRDAAARLMPQRVAAVLALLGVVVGAALILLVDRNWSLILGVLIMFTAGTPLVAHRARQQGRRFL
jgi:uncharacterized iron-regulated membrane protein